MILGIPEISLFRFGIRSNQEATSDGGSQRNLDMEIFLKPDEITFIEAIRKTNSITDVAKFSNENNELVDKIVDNVDRASF